MKIQAEVARALKIPEIREKLIQQGADPVGSTPDEFAAYIRAETAKWAKVVKGSARRPTEREIAPCSSRRGSRSSPTACARRRCPRRCGTTRSAPSSTGTRRSFPGR